LESSAISPPSESDEPDDEAPFFFAAAFLVCFATGLSSSLSSLEPEPEPESELSEGAAFFFGAAFFAGFLAELSDEPLLSSESESAFFAAGLEAGAFF